MTPNLSSPAGVPNPSREVRVTAMDIEHPEDNGTMEIMDDYCLIAAGTCQVTYTQVSQAKDGSETHVVTIEGVRR